MLVFFFYAVVNFSLLDLLHSQKTRYRGLIRTPDFWLKVYFLSMPFSQKQHQARYAEVPWPILSICYAFGLILFLALLVVSSVAFCPSTESES